ncbi:MAG: transketolase C-terminal domain-containing protein [Parcubacteria group bacterium]
MLKDFINKHRNDDIDAIRNGFGEALAEEGEKNKDIVVLAGDVTESTRCDKFAEKFPKRFFNVGVAEQGMASIAAGFGISGKIPFIASYAAFSPGRNWEQIRTTIAYNDSNVKIAGHHAGIMTGPDGATHQAIEDIATMRVMPNMKVIVPCDVIEAKKATIAASKMWGPVYLRFVRERTPIITTEEAPFIPGKAEIFWDSSGGKKRKTKIPQVCIAACGPLVANALTAAETLNEEGIGSVVLNVHTIKPLDEKKILEMAKKCGAFVSVEDHSVIGGLGSAIAELLAKEKPTSMEFIGMQDTFGESGDPWELVQKYEMSAKDIVRAAKRAIKNA